METAYFNGSFLPADKIRISPDDRGFLFADGVYEVIRWYEGFFYDMESHISRLKRSLKEIRLNWDGAEQFPAVAKKLIELNELQKSPSMVYLQVTRGAAKRSHAFPSDDVSCTVYSFARAFDPKREIIQSGIKTIIRNDWRWSRCDIKSISLLPNILSFQEAWENGCYECIFSRDGVITECAHSNLFFVLDEVIRTHPESEHILSGISRKNILRIAREAGIPAEEKAIHESMLEKVSEAFVTNTSFEISPVLSIGNMKIGEGIPGPVTLLLREKFDMEIASLKESTGE
ncbi:MAG: aminotransferase class IV [Bacteroidales bacterium]|nr:aminotransferase class IV [Bacteroidales bacterium]